MNATNAPAASFDAAANLARQAVYRFAAISFSDPKHGAWEHLGTLRNDAVLIQAAALTREMHGTDSPELGIGERPITELDPQRVLDRLPRSRRALNSQFEATFGLLVSSTCPPYETEYINSKFAFQRSNTLADISGYYRAFGFEVAERHPERSDHIVLELEFMIALLSLERQAADANSNWPNERQLICRDAQQSFLQGHLAWWAPAFAKLLRRTDPEGFYAAAGAFVAALIPAERATLGIPSTLQPAAPSRDADADLCEGCELAG